MDLPNLFNLGINILHNTRSSIEEPATMDVFKSLSIG